MKNIAFTLCLAACLLIAGRAFAFDTPVTDEQVKAEMQKTADSLAKYTEKFNCKNFVWANIANGGQLMTLQFMPEGLPDPSQWSRMLSITVYGLTGVQKDDAKTMASIILGLESQYKRIGDVTTDNNYMMDYKDPALFMEYTTGKGTPLPVTSAAAFLRVSDKSAAFMVLNARGRPFLHPEVLEMHRLVNPTAEVPQPERR